jgi:phytoene synthase
LDKKIQEGFRKAEIVSRRFSPKFHLATRFLPKEKKQASQAIIAFLKMSDDIVDNPYAKASEKRRNILKWTGEWEKAFENESSESSILNAASHVFHKYGIPFEYSKEFMDTMVEDIRRKSCKNYEELRKFMYGTASVVSLMELHILGFKDKRAIKHAIDTSYAIQLTNIIRDVKEDYDKRGRIYLPRDEMREYGVSGRDIADGIFTSNMKDLIMLQVSRANEGYKSAKKLIRLMEWRNKISIRLAVNVYSNIMQKIKERDYNIFSGKIDFTGLEKTRIILGSLAPF